MKILLTLFIFSFALLASDTPIALKKQILEKVFKNISLNKELVLWCDDKNLLSAFKEDSAFKTAQTPESATLLILNDKQALPKSIQNKAVFALDYTLLKELPQSFGAMFWKKGRPNIVIIAPRAKNQNILISENLDSYVEDAVW
ncbi:MAG: hypothetical protein QG559_8 [Campylobacterota bacterium]|nr:hypothetical protein [Campylobacterota bacterium]